jgi:phospholipid-transporting ATPase
MISYSHVIPISLYVALEMIKIGLAQMIYYDNEMFDVVADKPSIAKTSELIEELGQVEFIFSDKTGTLTQNVMEFRKCAIDDKVYGENQDPKRNDEHLSVNGDTSAYQLLLTNNKEKINERKGITDFFRLLSVCHSAISETNRNGMIKYSVNYFLIQ